MSVNLSGQRRLATGAFACIVLAGVVVPASSAVAAPYPPSLPGPSVSETAVLGSRVQSGTLAQTGSEVLPYAAGAGILVLGGAGLLLAGRRKGQHSSS